MNGWTFSPRSLQARKKPPHHFMGKVWGVYKHKLRCCFIIYMCVLSAMSQKGLMGEFSSLLSLVPLGCQGYMREASAKVLFQIFLWEAIMSSFGFDRDVNTLTLSIQHFFSSFVTVLSHWYFSFGKFWLLSPGKSSCDRVRLPNLWCMLGVLVFIIHQTLTWIAGSLTCTWMLMHAILHGGIRTL